MQETFYALNSFLNGPSFRSLAASVRARNLLNPVVAAPRPSAAALASTSSREAMIPVEAELAMEVRPKEEVGATMVVCPTGAMGPAGGAIEACCIPERRLLKSSSIFC